MPTTHREWGHFCAVIAAVTLVGALAGVWQWQRGASLRMQIDLARFEIGELPRLRAENERLSSQQVPVGELERLRADHAALPRLRAELEALQKATSAP